MASVCPPAAQPHGLRHRERAVEPGVHRGITSPASGGCQHQTLTFQLHTSNTNSHMIIFCGSPGTQSFPLSY